MNRLSHCEHDRTVTRQERSAEAVEWRFMNLRDNLESEAMKAVEILNIKGLSCEDRLNGFINRLADIVGLAEEAREGFK